jgi:hypothetical protein
MMGRKTARNMLCHNTNKKLELSASVAFIHKEQDFLLLSIKSF